MFDCDGVLIDTRGSYDATIVAVVDRLVRDMFGVVLPWKAVSGDLIQGLRNTGGFNNDWDAVYAIILFAACSMPARYRRNFLSGGPEGPLRPVMVSRTVAIRIFTEIRRMVRRLTRKWPESGRYSVDEFVMSLPDSGREICEAVGRYLGYPGNPPRSLLASLFDEMYHGGRLYTEMYGLRPRYHSSRGFIESDRVIVRSPDLRSLSKLVNGNLALATGRPRRAAEYSLGRLMGFFKPEASVFIGDADIRPTPESNEYRKPSGKSLLLAEREFKSRQLIYVGDSAEDWQMVINARRQGGRIAFAGIYSTSYEPADKLRFFKREGAEMILPTVRELPSIMSGVSG